MGFLIVNLNFFLELKALVCLSRLSLGPAEQTPFEEIQRLSHPKVDQAEAFGERFGEKLHGGIHSGVTALYQT